MTNQFKISLLLLTLLIICKINIQAQQFYESTNNSSIDSVTKGSLDFSDVDNDGDQDLLLTGINTLGHGLSNLYINNNGPF